MMAVAMPRRPESVRSLLHRRAGVCAGWKSYGPVTAEDQRAVGDAVEVLGGAMSAT